MASSECKPIMGIWGQSLQWGPGAGPGAEPWSGGQGGEASLKLKALKHLYTKEGPKICCQYGKTV